MSAVRGVSVVCALLAGAVLVAFPSAAMAQSVTPASSGEMDRGISVLGQGSVTTTPGAARVTLGVEVSDASLATAQAQAGQRMDAVLAALRAAGIADTDIRTASLTVTPQYDTSQGGQSGTLRGFSVQNLVEVRSTHLDTLGALIDSATAAGATRVQGIAFEPGDLDAAQTQARNQALQDARVKAEQIASASGLSLGRIVAIQSLDATPGQPVALAQPQGVQRATPVEPGQLVVHSTVRVMWDIRS